MHLEVISLLCLRFERLAKNYVPRVIFLGGKEQGIGGHSANSIMWQADKFVEVVKSLRRQIWSIKA